MRVDREGDNGFIVALFVALFVALLSNPRNLQLRDEQTAPRGHLAFDCEDSALVCLYYLLFGCPCCILQYLSLLACGVLGAAHFAECLHNIAVLVVESLDKYRCVGGETCEGEVEGFA